MEIKTLLGAPIWPHWIITALAFALFVEYLRLVLTTQTPAYRVIVMVVLGIAFGVSLVRLLRAARHPAESGDR